MSYTPKVLLIVAVVVIYFTVRVLQIQENDLLVRNIRGPRRVPRTKGAQHVELTDYDDYTYGGQIIGNGSEIVTEDDYTSTPHSPKTESPVTKDRILPSPSPTRVKVTPKPTKIVVDFEHEEAYVRNINGSLSFNPKENPHYYNFTEDELIPNFYNDKYETYDCHARYTTPGSNPRFMVLGVHKGGSTALYNYLAKHGRIRPAVCKEIHFFDEDEEFLKGKAYYLKHFPDVSMWRSKVITGEGSPDYIRIPGVPPKVKSMFPDAKFIVTLREPSTRFQSHWVGKKDQHILPFAGMSCEQAWNTSVAQYEKCLEQDDMLTCEKKLHENAVMRGVYLPQIQQWLRYFPANQFLIIQAESMFHNISKIMQQTVKFLNIRPYSEEELSSLQTAKTGSAHHEEPLAKECDHLMERMNTFYAEPNRRLKEFLKRTFPHVLDDWVEGWSGM